MFLFLLIFPAFIDQTRALHHVFLLKVCTTGVRISRIFFESDEYLCPLLYIDDMKLFAASENKLLRVMAVAKNGMESTGVKWNQKKCAVIQVKRGQVKQVSRDKKIAYLTPIKSVDHNNTYKFLGVFENTKQEDKQVLEAAAKIYLQRLSVNWSSPFSDHAAKVVASNHYALPVLTYLMWTQTWPIANIQQLGRKGRKIIVENGGNQSKGSTMILYMSW